MTKIADNFNGYLKMGEDTFAYNVSNHLVTLFPAHSDPNERHKILGRVCNRNTDIPEYLFGEDQYYTVALLRNSELNRNMLGLNTSIRFTAPIIVKSLGNAAGFYDMMTVGWNKFHAITFYGGNINAIYNPLISVEKEEIEKYLKNDGVREIKTRPYDDYTLSSTFKIDGEQVNLTISVLQTGASNNKERMGAYTLGELNSLIQFSFEDAKDFTDITRYYKIAKSLISILTKSNNITFEVYLSQKNSDNLFFKTGVCKILDQHDNYSSRQWHNVIPICNIIEYIPNLINKITNNDIDSLLTLLPEDNRKVNIISITNIQDLCTALEVAYNWIDRVREKDTIIVELKKNIKETISDFLKNHEGIDVYKETTISSAFQYLDYTLKDKILTLYNENCDIVDTVIKMRGFLEINEENVSAFVKLRNRKTHSGTIDWGNSAELYPALFALVYACLFRYIGMPDEIIKNALLQIF